MHQEINLTVRDALGKARISNHRVGERLEVIFNHYHERASLTNILSPIRRT